MESKRGYKFAHLDVFAQRPLERNPLAVFQDARGLNDKEMQTIASEMRLSETTFVFPREETVERSKGIRTRIFTVSQELPFAGHPTLGTAWVLRGNGSESKVVLDLNVGSVQVLFSKHGGDNYFGEVIQPEPIWGKTHERRKVASSLGVNESELDPSLPVQTVSTGNPFAIVPFRSLDTLRKLRLSMTQVQDYLATTDAKYFYLVSGETQDSGARLHARMIFEGGEDPATGSAAGPAAAWMLKNGLIKPEEQAWIE
jgi:trans-2,3-dihydro-3-hydroxyanthranilate isomerase